MPRALPLRAQSSVTRASIRQIGVRPGRMLLNRHLKLPVRRTACALVFTSVLLDSCQSSWGRVEPSIHFTMIPESGPGGSKRLESIAGRVTGAKAGDQIVLFAKSGTWWVQPFSNRQFTAVQPDSTWKNSTHMGTEYAALLVRRGYAAPKTTDALPGKGGPVLAVAAVAGRTPRSSTPIIPKKLYFSGYEWDVLQLASDSGGVMHPNSASNAWTDTNGWLHLQMRRESGEWAGAEISLSRSLGYGSYSFFVERIPRFEPGAVLGMFTWDPLEAGQNHREIDIEVSQWGDPASKNTQFTVQPYYVPANVYRFISPSAALTHSFHWEPGNVSFKTVREREPKGPPVAGHVSTSGIPTPGGERVHINLYVYGKSRTPQREGVEVVIEKFEYLP